MLTLHWYNSTQVVVLKVRRPLHIQQYISTHSEFDTLTTRLNRWDKEDRKTIFHFLQSTSSTQKHTSCLCSIRAHKKKSTHHNPLTKGQKIEFLMFPSAVNSPKAEIGRSAKFKGKRRKSSAPSKRWQIWPIAVYLHGAATPTQLQIQLNRARKAIRNWAFPAHRFPKRKFWCNCTK